MYTWTCILVEGSRSGTNHVFQQGSPIKERAPHRLPCFPIPQLKRSGGLSSKAEMGILLFPKHKRGRHLCHHFCSLSWIIFSSLFFVIDHLSIHQVLLFHHFTRDKFFVNPHTSFQNPNCPKDHGSRVSVEIRVALYFWHIYILNHFVFLTSIHLYFQQFWILTHVFSTWPILNWFLRAVSCFDPKNSAQSNLFERVSVFRWPSSHLTFKVAKSSRLFFSWPGPD